MTIYKQRLTDHSHPCLTDNGGCEQICLPADGGRRTCACGMQYKKVGETGCESYKTFLVVTQLDVARGYSIEVNFSTVCKELTLL